MSDPLSYDRIKMARETLTAAFAQDDFPGAREQDDPGRVFVEAKRNLTALVQHLHGQAAWERMLREDGSA